MLRDNKLKPTGVSIEPAESQDEKLSRSVQVKLFRWQAVTAGLCLLARSLLLYVWTKYTIRGLQQSDHLISGLADIVAWAFLFTEIAFTAYRLYPQHLQSIAYGPKAAFRPRLRITGTQVPKVDVLIFYCGEELSILLDTARAACSLDYPQDQFRVTVLDDSNSASEAIKALQSRYPNIFYSARKGKDKSWHKAGNINHGLEFMASLPGGPYELVAGLDVDMIPEKDWLRRLAPHLCLDPKVGLVSSNQRFYNVPPRDPLGQLLQFDQLQFVRQLRKDFGGIGLGGGTGWVASRVALDSIGGFAVDSICEDFLTCVDVTEAGWTVALLDEDLQWGLLPGSLNGHTKQIQRWTSAMLSFYQALSFGSAKRRHQRGFQIAADVSTIAYVVAMNLCYFGLPLMVLSGHPLVHIDSQDQLQTLIRLGFADFMAQSAQGFLESWTANFTIYCWHEPSHLWHAPLYVGPLLRRWLPTLAAITVGKVAKLSPGISAANKSSETRYISRWQRLKVIYTECSVLPHLFVLGTCIAGAVLFLYNATYHHLSATDHSTWTYIVTHVGYPPALFLWSSALRSACTPFWYAVCVPRSIARETLLAGDEKSEAAYPTPEAKDQRHRRVKEWHLVFTLAYFLAVFVWSSSRV
ncbi:MAG: hypothetical protein L6R36_001948 [Xanthoria steineri]|nr:MAG: hypothetical protein L6R36_001948 [Xanthoria steineri]